MVKKKLKGYIGTKLNKPEKFYAANFLPSFILCITLYYVHITDYKFNKYMLIAGIALLLRAILSNKFKEKYAELYYRKPGLMDLLIFVFVISFCFIIVKYVPQGTKIGTFINDYFSVDGVRHFYYVKVVAIGSIMMLINDFVNYFKIKISRNRKGWFYFEFI